MSTINLNNTTPSAPTGTVNVEWQQDTSSPRNVSAYLPEMEGDSGSGGTAGAVPAPPAGSAAGGKFLKADGTWEVAGTVTSVGLTLPSIFSVAGSPVTGAGTLAATLANEAANSVLAGPASGSAAAPAFRTLTAADIPTIAESQVTNLTTDLTTLSGNVAGKAPTARAINTTAPLTGGGDLSSDRTLGINNFTGDAGTGGANGAVPAPGSGDGPGGKFLKADGTWAVPPGTATGTVTSVGLSMPVEFSIGDSPVTGAGTLTVTKTNQNANLVYAGPLSGTAAAPAFRALVAADIPAIAESGVTNLTSDLAAKTPIARVINTTAPLTGGGDLAADRTLSISNFTGDSGAGGAKGAVPAPSSGDAAGGKFLKADGTWAVPPGTTSGTVSSVGLSMPAEFSVANSPVTGAATLTVTKANQNANLVYAGPSSGSAAAPGFRALAAADIPAIPESGITNLTPDLAAKAPTARVINTSAPLTGGGDLTADRTLAISTFTGDAGSGGATGAVPAPPAGAAAAGKYLKADGSWSVPTTSGSIALGTGSTLTITQSFEFVSGCQAGVAVTSFSTPSSNAPTPNVVTGSNVITGVLSFTATGQSAQLRLVLPSDWVSGAGNNIEFRFRSAATTGNIVWNIATAGIASTGATIDPAFNTAQTASVAAQGTTLQDNLATVTTFTTTGCVAGGILFLKIALDASTTTTGTIDLISLRVILKRAITTL